MVKTAQQTVAIPVRAVQTLVALEKIQLFLQLAL
jgi:hypothetical protein